MLDQRRELARLVQARTEETRNLRDEDLGCQEAIEGLRKLLHELLVLVELLEVVNALEGDALLLRRFAVDSIAQHANLHARPWHMRQLHGARETFVALRVVVLQGDLKLNRLQEL